MCICVCEGEREQDTETETEWQVDGYVVMLSDKSVHALAGLCICECVYLDLDMQRERADSISWQSDVVIPRHRTHEHGARMLEWDLLDCMRSTTQPLTAWLGWLGWFVWVVWLHFSLLFLLSPFSSSISFNQSFQPGDNSAHLLHFFFFPSKNQPKSWQ